MKLLQTASTQAAHLTMKPLDRVEPRETLVEKAEVLSSNEKVLKVCKNIMQNVMYENY